MTAIKWPCNCDAPWSSIENDAMEHSATCPARAMIMTAWGMRCWDRRPSWAAIMAKYPKLFRESWAKNEWGFECDEGWAEIIDEMCSRMEACLKAFPVEDFKVAQIKEKFGTLTVYYRPMFNERIDEIINDAEAKSGETCEVCGKPGENRFDLAWHMTLCDEHFQQRLKEGWSTW